MGMHVDSYEVVQRNVERTLQISGRKRAGTPIVERVIHFFDAMPTSTKRRR